MLIIARLRSLDDRVLGPAVWTSSGLVGTRRKRMLVFGLVVFVAMTISFTIASGPAGLLVMAGPVAAVLTSRFINRRWLWQPQPHVNGTDE